jgi:hypothetical protein
MPQAEIIPFTLLDIFSTTPHDAIEKRALCCIME